MRLLVFAVLVSAVGPATAAAQPEPTNPEETAAQREQRRAQVVVRVGETAITVGEVEDTLNAEAAFLRARHQSPEGLRAFIENMIERELLAQEATRQGFAEHPEVRRTAKQNAVQQLVRQEFDQRLTWQSIPEADAQAYYDAHESDYSRPEMVRASHILVETEEEARQLLEQVRNADPRAFRQLAAQRSIDNETKMRGGDLRYFTRDGRPPGSQDAPVDPALVAAAFALENRGDTVPRPVRVGQNWSVLKLTNRRPAQHRTFAEVEHSIRLRLWRERREQAVQQFVEQLETRLAPRVFPERMRPIELEVTPPRPGLPSPHTHHHESDPSDNRDPDQEASGTAE